MLILLSKPSVFLSDSMMLLIHSLIPSTLSTERMRITLISSREYHRNCPRFQQSCPRFYRFGYGCWTHVYNPSSCPTVFQHLFSAITRFIAFFLVIMPMYLCQSIQSVLSYVFHPNRGLFYQDQTNFHLHDQIQPPQMITSSNRHQRMYIYSWPYRPFLHIRALQKPRNIKVFSPHRGGLILVYTLRTFRHKQDSTLVTGITTIYSISMLYLPPFNHNI